MLANVSVKNYNGKRCKYQGNFNIDNNIINIEMPNGIKLYGHDVDHDTNETITLKGDSHIMELDWKGSFKLSGRWKSLRGEWSTITINLPEVKEKIMESWWDKEKFVDYVDTILLSFMYGKLKNEYYTWKQRIVNQKDFNIIKKKGPYFTPYLSETEDGDWKINKKSITDFYYVDEMLKKKILLKNSSQLVTSTFDNELDKYPGITSLVYITGQYDEKEQPIKNRTKK